MEYRPLGRTGVKVSPLCLGAMMFGAWGNEDHDDSISSRDGRRGDRVFGGKGRDRAKVDKRDVVRSVERISRR